MYMQILNVFVSYRYNFLKNDRNKYCSFLHSYIIKNSQIEFNLNFL